MAMTLDNLDFLSLLPAFMKEDAAVQALSQAMNNLLGDPDGRIASLSGWTHLEAATEQELDELAWELSLPWYETGASRETKIRLIQHAEEVRRKLGTKWALETILSDYFGPVEVTEWPDYFGEPHHFKIYAENEEATNSRKEQFDWLLSIAQRDSSRCDDLSIGLTGHLPVYAGPITLEASKDQNVMPLPFQPVYAGCFLHQMDYDTYTVGGE